MQSSQAIQIQKVEEEIEEIKKKIEGAEVERNKYREKLEAAVLAREPTDIRQDYKTLLDSATQELDDLREEKLKLIERQTALETSNIPDNGVLELIPLVKEQNLLSKRFMDEAAENETTSSKRSKTAQDAFRSGWKRGIKSVK